MSTIEGSGFIYRKVLAAPANHAKLMIINDELYVVGSDNLYPGHLSEFNSRVSHRHIKFQKWLKSNG